MITYNPQDWWQLIFAFHRSDSFRVLLPGMCAVAAYTAGAAYLENQVLHASFRNPTIVHSLIGFVNKSSDLALKLHAFLVPAAVADRAPFRTLIVKICRRPRNTCDRGGGGRESGGGY
jgi:hypothetical protein